MNKAKKPDKILHFVTDCFCIEPGKIWIKIVHHFFMAAPNEIVKAYNRYPRIFVIITTVKTLLPMISCNHVTQSWLKYEKKKQFREFTAAEEK